LKIENKRLGNLRVLSPCSLKDIVAAEIHTKMFPDANGVDYSSSAVASRIWNNS